MTKWTIRRPRAAFACALTLLAGLALTPGALAGKPGGGGGGGGGTVATAYSGDAQVVDADLSVLGAVLPPISVDISKVGPLPATGGFDHTSLITIADPDPSQLLLTANVASASIAGAGDRSHSSASVANVALGLGALTPTLVGVRAGVLRSSATASCGANGPVLSGGSSILDLGLTVAGTDIGPIVVTGAPNQTIEVPGVVRIVINEQIVGPGSITVNALHITLIPPDSILAPVLTGDVVISRAHADIVCGPGTNPPPCQVKDFVTGGGQIIVGSPARRISFGMVGGQKPNGLSGHFNLVDHGNGRHLQGTTLTNYEVIDATTRRLTYTGTSDGQPTVLTVVVSDKGEPGTADTISVQSSTGGYTVSGTLAGGNIQLHKPGGCETTTKPPKGGGPKE